MPPQTVRELLESFYGVALTTDENPVAESVGTAAVELLKNDPARVGFTVVNLSLNTVFLRANRAPSNSAGIRLAPNGGSVSLNWKDDGEMVAWQWLAIADGAASAIEVLAIKIAMVN